MVVAKFPWCPNAVQHWNQQCAARARGRCHQYPAGQEPVPGRLHLRARAVRALPGLCRGCPLRDHQERQAGQGAWNGCAGSRGLLRGPCRSQALRWAAG